MPYRRLPNTDIARYKAIDIAVSKTFSLHPTEVPFSQKLLLQLKSFLPTFSQALTLYKDNTKHQKELSKIHAEATKKLKLYTSHFIQVLNFAIIRGEIKEKARGYFGINVEATNLPQIRTDKELQSWSEKLIAGEELRIREGGVAMTNPRIALVKIKHQEYVENLNSLKIAQKTTKLSQEKVASLRDEADSLILNLWNEIEASFEGLSAEERRDKASNFGVKYVFRPSER